MLNLLWANGGGRIWRRERKRVEGAAPSLPRALERDEGDGGERGGAWVRLMR